MLQKEGPYIEEPHSRNNIKFKWTDFLNLVPIKYTDFVEPTSNSRETFMLTNLAHKHCTNFNHEVL